MAAYRIDFINENNAGRMFFGGFEHVADTRCTNPDKHFHEVRTGNGKERHLGFPCNSSCQKRFPGPRRPHQQQATRDTAAQFLKFIRIAQEIHDFMNFFLRFIATGNIVEGNRIVFLVDHARLGFTERKSASFSTTLHLAHEKYPDANQKQHGEP